MNELISIIIISIVYPYLFFLGGIMKDIRTTNISENEVLFKECPGEKERKRYDEQRGI